MPKIGNPVPLSDIPCGRCNSKRRISKSWVEKIPNSNGFMTLYHSQIVCTNKTCQEAFEKALSEDLEKRERFRQSKLEHSAKKLAPKTA